MSVFAASVRGRNAFLGTLLCQVWGRKGSRAEASAPLSCLLRNEETQHFAAQALKVHSLLVVILEKRFGGAALPQTECSSLLSPAGGGQSTASTSCVETGHLRICWGSGYFVNGAMQVLSTPDILLAKKELKMLVKLHFGLQVPQIQDHCLVKHLCIQPVPFPYYLIIVQ